MSLGVFEPYKRKYIDISYFSHNVKKTINEYKIKMKTEYALLEKKKIDRKLNKIKLQDHALLTEQWNQLSTPAAEDDYNEENELALLLEQADQEDLDKPENEIFIKENINEDMADIEVHPLRRSTDRFLQQEHALLNKYMQLRPAERYFWIRFLKEQRHLIRTLGDN